MEPWREEVRDDYLMHYGVKGMKWKKRKAFSETDYGYKNDAYTYDGLVRTASYDKDPKSIARIIEMAGGVDKRTRKKLTKRKNQILTRRAEARRGKTKQTGYKLVKKGKMYAKRALY